MITTNSLPQGYVAYETLRVCSNTLQGGGNLLALGEVLPLVVGSGPIPQVWLQAPKNKEAKDFALLVEASVSRHPLVAVSSSADGLLVTVGGTLLLRVRQQSAAEAIVDVLDLRPIGLNVYGDSASLHAGGATFQGNTFSGVGTLIGIGVGI
jgi:hypothetical protein